MSQQCRDTREGPQPPAELLQQLQTEQPPELSAELFPKPQSLCGLGSRETLHNEPLCGKLHIFKASFTSKEEKHQSKHQAFDFTHASPTLKRGEMREPHPPYDTTAETKGAEQTQPSQSRFNTEKGGGNCKRKRKKNGKKKRREVAGNKESSWHQAAVLGPSPSALTAAGVQGWGGEMGLWGHGMAKLGAGQGQISGHTACAPLGGWGARMKAHAGTEKDFQQQGCCPGPSGKEGAEAARQSCRELGNSTGGSNRAGKSSAA